MATGGNMRPGRGRARGSSVASGRQPCQGCGDGARPRARREPPRRCARRRPGITSPWWRKRCASSSTGAWNRCRTSTRRPRCSSGCAAPGGAAGPRRAAPRATAAPARWCWASWTARQCALRAVNACILFVPDARRQGALHGREPAARRTARCTRCSRPWWSATARSAASARPASSCRCSRCTRASARRRRGGGSTTPWPETCAAAPATARSWRRCGRPIGAAPGDGAAARETRPRPCAASSARTRSTWRAAASGFVAPRTLDALAAFFVEPPAARAWWRAATDVGLLGHQAASRARSWWSRSARSPSCARIRGHGDPPRDRRRGDATPTRSGRWPHSTRSSASWSGGIGSTQIRNVGTVGGNIANGSPIGDMPPALIALGCQRGPAPRRGAARAAARGLLPRLRKQALRPGEFVERIRIPHARRRARSSGPTSSPSGSIRTSPPCAPRSRSSSTAGGSRAARMAFGGMAAIAQPRRRRRGGTARASPGPRRRSRRRRRRSGPSFRPSPTCAPAPPTAAWRRGTCSASSGSRRRRAARTRVLAAGGHAMKPATQPGVALRQARRRRSPHDSAERHVTGEARYVDDLPEPSGPAPRLRPALRPGPRPHRPARPRPGRAPRRGGRRCSPRPTCPAPTTSALSLPGDLVLADGAVEYCGQSVLAVAAETLDQARRAAHLATIEYEDLPAADHGRSRRWRQASFVLPTQVMRRGDASAALAARPAPAARAGWPSAARSTSTWRARWRWPSRARTARSLVHSSTQHPSEVQHLVAQVLGHRPGRGRGRGPPAWAAGSAARRRQAAPVACIAALRCARGPAGR